MRTNIRRSIAVAAAATGLWALGTVTANAAELPVQPGPAGRRHGDGRRAAAARR